MTDQPRTRANDPGLDRRELLKAGVGAALGMVLWARSSQAAAAPGTAGPAAPFQVAVLDAGGRRVTRWASLPAGAIVTSVAVSGERVYVADAGNRAVYRFDAGGKRLGSIGGTGKHGEDEGFVIPSPWFDLAVDPGGTLWVVNPGRHRLENYADDGRLRSSWGEGSAEPEGFCGCCNPIHLAILPDGRFVTSEKGIPRVKVYHPTGRLQAVVAGPETFDQGSANLDLAVDGSGRLLVLDPSRRGIRVYRPAQRSAESGGAGFSRREIRDDVHQGGGAGFSRRGKQDDIHQGGGAGFSRREIRDDIRQGGGTGFSRRGKQDDIHQGGGAGFSRREIRDDIRQGGGTGFSRRGKPGDVSLCLEIPREGGLS